MFKEDQKKRKHLSLKCLLIVGATCFEMAHAGRNGSTFTLEGEESMQQVIEAVTTGEVTKIDFHGKVNVTDDDIAAIAKTPNSQTLLKFDLRNNPGITEASLMTLLCSALGTWRDEYQQDSFNRCSTQLKVKVKDTAITLEDIEKYKKLEFTDIDIFFGDPQVKAKGVKTLNIKLD